MSDFWIWMFIVNMIIPIVMLIIGVVFQTNPPRRMNSIYGYRTKRSLKDEKSWLFAQNYLGKTWFKMSLVLSPVTILLMLMVYQKLIDTIAYMTLFIVAIQVFVLLSAIFMTEKALIKMHDYSKSEV